MLILFILCLVVSVIGIFVAWLGLGGRLSEKIGAVIALALLFGGAVGMEFTSQQIWG